MFIELVLDSGGKVLLNADRIQYVLDCSNVHFSEDNYLFVTESYEEIKAMLQGELTVSQSESYQLVSVNESSEGDRESLYEIMAKMTLRELLFLEQKLSDEDIEQSVLLNIVCIGSIPDGVTTYELTKLIDLFKQAKRHESI